MIWVIEQGLVGHLAVAERGGVVSNLLGHPTLYFRTPYEAVPALWKNGVPAGITAENVPLDQLVDLMRMDQMAAVPLLLVDEVWPDGEAPPNLMDRNWRNSRGEQFVGTYEALTEFAAAFFSKKQSGRS